MPVMREALARDRKRIHRETCRSTLSELKRPNMAVQRTRRLSFRSAARYARSARCWKALRRRRANDGHRWCSVVVVALVEARPST